jgi:hypothetical protein
MINRRGLITGLISFVAAPAIVRATSLDYVPWITRKKRPIQFVVGDYVTIAEVSGGPTYFQDPPIAVGYQIFKIKSVSSDGNLIFHDGSEVIVA